jgi:drug/metabolite transporter (DMT)-like permease
MGALLVVLSALGFSTLGVFGKMAFEEGFTLNQALFWRFAFALPVMFLISILFKATPSTPRAFLPSVGLGFIGIGIEATLYFLTLQHLGAALTGIFLYLYPAIIAIISHFFLGKRLAGKQWACVALALIGCVLTAGAFGSEVGTVKSPLEDLVGLGLGILTGTWYAIYLLVGAKLTKDEHPLSVSLGIVLGSFLVFGLLTFWDGEHGTPLMVPSSDHAWIAILGLAGMASVLPFTTLYSGMKRVGAMAASLLSTLELVFTIILAAAFLGEKLTLLQTFGAGLILLSVLLTTLVRPQ